MLELCNRQFAYARVFYFALLIDILYFEQHLS